MTDPIRTHETTKPRSGLLGAAFALGLGTLLVAAQPAAAGNEFKNGFEDELGRIVAHHVAAIGTAFVAPAVVVHQRVHYAARPVHRSYYSYDRHYRGHRKHHRGHGYKNGHRHHRGCGHNYATHSRIRHDRHSRHDRRDRNDRRDRKGRGGHQRTRYDY